MLASTRRTFPFLLLAGCLLGLTGCGSHMVTTANKSYWKGLQYYNDKMYPEAAGAFRDAVRQDPRHHRSQFYLGVCYDQMNQHQQAFQQYRTTRQIMPTTLAGRHDPEFRLVVLDTLAAAIVRHDMNDTELNRTIRDAQESPTAENWFLLAKVHRLRGDADSAMEAYRQACNWDSRDFEVRKEFGLYLLDPLNQASEAEYYLRQAYRLDPTDAAIQDALLRLGVEVGPRSKQAPVIAAPAAPQVPAPYPSGNASLPRD